jgi:hypothetical protein
MQNPYIGAIAAAASLDGYCLKALVVGEGEAARNINCHLSHTEADTQFTNYL